MFSHEERCRYGRNPLFQVICQLRFPEILTIETTVPAQFQELIRRDFPRYSVRREPATPVRPGTPAQNVPTVNNYQFQSEDGVWRVNLTSKFISLACTRYDSWEEFAKWLDKPLAAFIKVYAPAYFERIGLRYLNFFSRKALELEGVPFRDLFQPCYLGLLADEEVLEQSAAQSTMDVEMAIRGGCRLKLHAGPGLIKTPGQEQDKEVRFIFDQDLFMPGKVQVNLSAAALATLHDQAWAIFRGAITDTLHDAMEPEYI